MHRYSLRLLMQGEESERIVDGPFSRRWLVPMTGQHIRQPERVLPDQGIRTGLGPDGAS